MKRTGLPQTGDWTPQEYDPLAWEQEKASRYNAQTGSLEGYDCPKCKNKGNIAYLNEKGNTVMRECACMQARRALRRMEKSGLGRLLEQCRFDNFQSEEPYQRLMLEKAKAYVQEGGDKWFFCGGQVGCGKTHICTAACGALLQQERDVRYMMWRDEAVRLKACVTEGEEYRRLIEPFKRADVLYIDDLFKTEQGKAPSAADVNVAFEILNYRYINPGLTIISTEKTMNELMDIDQAVGSRIYQKTKDYCVEILPEKRKNYRLFGKKK